MSRIWIPTKVAWFLTYTNLEEGVHQLKIKVWDVHNNSSEAFTEFVVVANEGLV